MKLTLNGALDLSRSINSQTIWNKRSTDYFNELAKELKQDSLKILVGSDFPLNKKEVRAEAGEVLDLPDKVAKALIKNNAAIKFDSKMIKQEEE